MAAYKIDIYFLNEDQKYPQGKTLYFDNAQVCFMQAVFLLRMGTEGDMIQLNKVENSTVVHFLDAPSIQVHITPNILSPGTEQVGPYSFMAGMMADEFPEH